MSLITVPLQSSDLSRLEPVIGSERANTLQSAAVEISAALSGRALISVNSTAKGGGVAEMLHWMLAYVRGAGVDVNWYVIEGTPEFFTMTKRLHNMLHGHEGDGKGLTRHDHEVFEEVTSANASDLRALVSRGDIVLLHDPQTAGLVAEMKRAGATVIWRCHVGTERSSELSSKAWDFLRPYLEEVDAFVFSRRELAPDWLDQKRLFIVPPSIDPFSTKNRVMSEQTARAILAHTGVLHDDSKEAMPEFVQADGSLSRVNRMADIVRTGPAPGPGAKLAVQVSRWDRLKDMQGVMGTFASKIDGEKDSHLVLAGPVVTGVADDPEGGEVLTECIEAWRELPHFERSRIQLICIPMTDIDENAAVVNALQTHASLVIQKSLEEGFGLTVTEAMWKGKPVVASAVGGIQDQIVHGESGLLVQDPRDANEFSSAVQSILDDESLATRLGRNAKARVIEQFLGDRHLLQYAELVRSLG
jgi:trehalose synthase